MNLAGFLADLEARQVRLRADGDRLHCTAPPGVLTAELVGQIRQRKVAILRLLHDRDTIAPAGRSGAPPLSFAQERLWLHNHIDPADSAYHLPMAVRLQGPLALVVLRQAFAEVARRHEIMRTRYRTRQGRPCLEIDASAAPPAVVDLTGLPPVVRAATARVLAEREARRPFTLATAPGMRTSLLRCGPTEHRLLITRHHIASDGWSFGVLGSELNVLYAAFLGGRPSPLAELTLQYADFARWQRQLVEGDVARSKFDQWMRRAEQAPTTVGLISDRVPSGPPQPVGTLQRTLDGQLTDRIRRVARDAGTTVFTALLAAFGVVVAAAVDHHEVVIGSPAAGRVHPDLEPLIGSFATMLPLRLDLAGDPTFGELLRRVHGVVGAALDVQDIPQEWLVDAVQREQARTGGAPLFSVVFTYQAIPPAQVDLPGLTATAEEPVPVAPKFPLTFTATPGAGEHALLAEFDRGRIHQDAVAALVDRVIAVIELASARPDERCAALVRTVASRSRAALPERPPARDDRTLAVRFTATAADAPDAVAVSCDGAQLTYRALDRLARRLATRLTARGVGAESIVGLCMEPSIDLIVAIIGCTLSGAAYLPLDPEDPPARHETVIGDAAIAALVTNAGSADRFTWYDGPTLRVDGDRPVGPGAQPSAGLADQADQLAYVIYTSGSTGAPKGVMVSHRNVSGMFAAAQARFGCFDRDVWTLAHSAAFDFSVWEMWGALLHGGRLVVLPRRDVLDPAELWRVVCSEQITILSTTPSAFSVLAPAAMEGRGPAGLRAVVFGGERCDPAPLRGWWERFGVRRPHLINMFGITETTVHVTHRRLTPADADAGEDSPIGLALPGMRAHILDRHGVPTPIGGQGELLVGGCGVARGYLHRPGLTADRFRPDAVSGEPGSRLYRSGDLVRLLPDGELGYLGRLDHQVQVRGHRIEVGEVESALATHPDVAASAVVIRRDGQRCALVGYVVAVAGARPSAVALRRFLSERLPRYMIPPMFVTLDRLPLTRNGKLDYDMLPAPSAAGSAEHTTWPRTATERTLATMWTELLGVEPIGVHDNFFDLGGDSLLVTRLHARLPGAFGIDLPMRLVYQALDIASLAVAIDTLRSESADADLLRLVEEVETMPEEELRRRLR